MVRGDGKVIYDLKTYGAVELDEGGLLSEELEAAGLPPEEPEPEGAVELEEGAEDELVDVAVSVIP